MTELKPLHALFGGTFDPIHYGHLRTAEALAKLVRLNTVTLLPNNVPPHRPQPEASPAQRIHMLELAIRDNPLFHLDLREMQRDTPSWTIDTLSEWRSEHGSEQPLAFIMGLDSLLTLHHWQRWQELTGLCHLLVCKRPGYQPQIEDKTLRHWLSPRLTTNIRLLNQQSAGLVFLADTPLVPVSATEIRQRHHLGLSCEDLLPAAVEKYIQQQKLYLPV